MLSEWQRESVEALLDEGIELSEEVANQLYLVVPEGELSGGTSNEEIQENCKEVGEAKIKEINGLYELGCSKRWPIKQSHNIIYARWVIIWKMIEGNVGVKCRFAVRGYKDQFQDLDTSAGATSRSGQRLANAIAADNFSFDVSRAFVKGLISRS